MSSSVVMPMDMSWHDYNEALVERGSMILDFSFLDSWKEELREMNGSNKVGRRFVYPDSYIEFLSYLKVGLDIQDRTGDYQVALRIL
ncbi:MAG: hypothetical protein QW508_03880 [Conexivisphaerales archaeon]